MTGLLTTFKRYFVFLILIVFLVLLLWIRLVVAPKVSQEYPSTTPSSLSPTPFIPEGLLLPTPGQTLEKNPSVLPSTSITFNYTGPVYNSPPTLPVFTPGEPIKIELETAQKYAKIFGFSDKPSLTDKNSSGAPFYLWSGDKRVFSIGGSLPVIHFNDYNNLSFTASVSGLSEDQLLNLVSSILNKLGVKNINFNDVSFKYYQTVVPEQKTGEAQLMETPNRSEASYVGIGLTYELDNYSVFTNTSEGSPLFFIFDPQGNTFQFTLYLFNPVKTTTNLGVLPFNEAVKSLNNKGVIIRALAKENINQEELPVYSLKEIDLNSVEIAYYLPVSFTNNILPYYVFTGQATDEKTGFTIGVKMALPTEVGF